MSARAAFVDRAAQQILVFDGGYGTAIQGYKLSEADYRGDLDLTMIKREITTCCRLRAPTLSAQFIPLILRRARI